jgi:hypothetical protein
VSKTIYTLHKVRPKSYKSNLDIIKQRLRRKVFGSKKEIKEAIQRNRTKSL